MIKKHIPNALTCANAVSGGIGIVKCFEGALHEAAAMILIAAVFDFFDGFAARMLKVSSPMGKELDSMADMVSFGVLPAMIMYKLMQGVTGDPYLPLISMLIVAFSALRLAKFNIDTRQSDSFIGVPTPTNALLIGSLPVIKVFHPEYAPYIDNLWLLIAVTVIMSLLLVAELPLLALKFKDFNFANNKFRFILIGTALILIVAFKALSVPLVVAAYIVLSVVNNMAGSTGGK
ncbi:CDP-diacylglycerol--serine O-phosphatidyltransferase [Limibacter armeniacum]|uniref:CDP-diacylglycerol--serine O-phosphatidyltransferase n=1 Tax=Limibacter armeniacum TaxID=466084 RepID=UPI002FE6B489